MRRKRRQWREQFYDHKAVNQEALSAAAAATRALMHQANRHGGGCSGGGSAKTHPRAPPALGLGGVGTSEQSGLPFGHLGSCAGLVRDVSSSKKA